MAREAADAVEAFTPHDVPVSPQVNGTSLVHDEHKGGPHAPRIHCHCQQEGE